MRLSILKQNKQTFDVNYQWTALLGRLPEIKPIRNVSSPCLTQLHYSHQPSMATQW